MSVYRVELQYLKSICLSRARFSFRVGAVVSAEAVHAPGADDQQERRRDCFFSTKGAVSGASL